MTPEEGRTGLPGTWHVYTDGSTRHERRQTFSGWAARAVQPETRQVRQVSGARPGGTSLDAETEAILAGLRLVPAGAPARLYSDLDLAVLLELLQGPVGEAAWGHLRDLWVHPIARNTGRHHHDVHRVSRAAEQEARQGEAANGTGLPNAVLEAQDLARTGEVDPPLALRPPRHLPGDQGPLQVRVTGVDSAARSGGRVWVTLNVTPLEVQGRGRSEEEALRDALTRGLTPLIRGSRVDLTVPPRLVRAATEVTPPLGVVQVTPDPEESG